MKQNKTMLIVDDFEMNRIILEDLLKEEYEIVHAENGQQALDIINLNNINIDVIIMDLVMPVMDAESFLENVKEMELTKKTPVFIMSVEITDEIIKKYYSYGVCDFFDKPYNLNLIKNRVRNMIELFEYRKNAKANI